jgi:adhesin/invasin
VGQPVSFGFAAGGEGAAVDPAEAITDTDGRAATSWRLGRVAGTQVLVARVANQGQAPLERPISATATPAEAESLAVGSGQNQAAEPATALAESLVVRAADRYGNPVPGVRVNWEMSTGGSVSPASALTSAEGRAATRRVLGTSVGVYTTRAVSAGLSGSILFTSIAASDPSRHPAAIAAQAGDGQTGTVGTALPVAPSVLVRDGANRPLAGIAVAFAVSSGGGTIGGAAAVTDAAGIAKAGSWTLGSAAGQQTVIASVSGSGVSGNPVTFRATARAGPPSGGRSSLTVAPAQIVASGGSGAATATVTVRDGFGNPVQGASVALSVSGGGNTISPATPSTDANGVATAAISSTVAESKTVSVRVGSVAIAQTATLQVAAGSAVASRTTATVPPGFSFAVTSIEIQSRDAFGNPCTTGGANLRVVVTRGSSSNVLAVQDRGDGTYHAAYIPGFPGTDVIQITLGGQPIDGSPYQSEVTFR